MPDWVLTLSVALLAALPGLYAIWRQAKKDKKDLVLQERKDLTSNRKDDASAAETYAGLASRQAMEIEKLQSELHDSKLRIDTLEKQVARLTIGVETLHKQLEDYGISPEWRLNE